MQFDLTTTDALLATTRSVRKRLDLSRPVPREVVLECLDLAVQAPTGGNQQNWRWLVVDDANVREQLAAIYEKGARTYLAAAAAMATKDDGQTARVYDSAMWLTDNLAKVPVFVIPCIEGRIAQEMPVAFQASSYGSIFPAVWSFQLALRARGLGSTLTTLHLIHENEAAQVLGIPDTVQQIALLPVAYTVGTDFKRAKRPPVSEITHWNHW
jgi:nitroreductase